MPVMKIIDFHQGIFRLNYKVINSQSILIEERPGQPLVIGG